MRFESKGQYMENAIYLTTKIYPDLSGGTKHDIGNCCYLSRKLKLTAFSYLDEKYSIREACLQNENMPFTYVPCHVQKSNGWYHFSARMSLVEDLDIEMLGKIEKQIKEQNVRFVFFTLKMCMYFWVLRKKYTNIRYIYISHNSEYMNICDDIQHYDQVNHITGLEHLFKLARIGLFKKREQSVVRLADRIFSISISDSRRLSEHYHVSFEKFVDCKPMINIETSRSKDAWSRYQHCILIVGNMNWYPTAEGVMWFARNVYPRLERMDPELRLYIVGGNPSQDIKALSRKNEKIIVTGFVDSVDKYYSMCDIAVVPVFKGTGAKIKVIEAVAQNIPSVISVYAADDYHQITEAVRVAGNADEFVCETLELMQNPQERKRLQESESVYYRKYMSRNEAIDLCLAELIG